MTLGLELRVHCAYSPGRPFCTGGRKLLLSFWAVPGLAQRLVVSVFPVTLAGEGLGARFCREATWDLERAGRWLAVMRLARSGRNLASANLP